MANTISLPVTFLQSISRSPAANEIAVNALLEFMLLNWEIFNFPNSSVMFSMGVLKLRRRW